MITIIGRRLCVLVSTLGQRKSLLMGKHRTLIDELIESRMPKYTNKLKYIIISCNWKFLDR